MAKKVCIQPCLGINENVTTIGRQAAYAAFLKLGADRADLGCAPALYADVREDVDFLISDWVIAIESCDKCCANHLVTGKGGSVHVTLRVDEFLRMAGFDVAALPREHAAMDHPAVVAVADEIVRLAHQLEGEGQA
jgi:uncharacterized metal-binding protein